MVTLSLQTLRLGLAFEPCEPHHLHASSVYIGVQQDRRDLHLHDRICDDVELPDAPLHIGCDRMVSYNDEVPWLHLAAVADLRIGKVYMSRVEIRVTITTRGCLKLCGSSLRRGLGWGSGFWLK